MTDQKKTKPLIPKKRSIRKLSLAALVAAGLIIAAIVLLYQFLSYRAMYNQLSESSRLVLNFYKSNLSEGVRQARSYGEELAYNDENLQLMSIRNLPPVQYYELEYKLRNAVGNSLSTDESIYSIHIIDRYRQHIISCYRTEERSNFGLEQTLKRRYLTIESEEAEQEIFSFEDEHYLLRVFPRGPITVVILIRLSDYAYRDTGWVDEGGNTFVTFEYDGRLYENAALAEEYGLTADNMHTSGGVFSRVFVYSDDVPGTSLKVHLINTSDNVLTQLRVTAIAMGVTLLVILATMVFVYRTLRELMIYPVNSIAKRMENLSAGGLEEIGKQGDAAEAPKPVDEESPKPEKEAANTAPKASEFELIDRSITELVTTMSELKNQYYEEQMQHQELMLQYYQLQTEPHFFLNCLKNISSMAEDGQFDRISRLSMAFSEHLRYIFRNGTNFVTLEEEVSEAAAYFRICTLRSKEPMLLEQDVDESLNFCLVPPLSIQTFIENTMKYGRLPDVMLHIQLQVRKIEKEDGPYVEIRVEDNGPGYSEEMLKELNGIGDAGGLASQKVGIHNLISRTRLLYGDEAEFAFYNGEEGHAVSVVVLPEKRRKKEVLDENSGS